MALVYFDASALVKLVVDEPGSDLADSLWDGCDTPLSNRLADVEVRAALAASRRSHDLDEDDLSIALDGWDALWSAVRPVELTAIVARRAGVLARDHALSGADAVHLASALALGERDLVMAVWDRRLHAGASHHLSVAPARLGPS